MEPGGGREPPHLHRHSHGIGFSFRFKRPAHCGFWVCTPTAPLADTAKDLNLAGSDPGDLHCAYVEWQST